MEITERNGKVTIDDIEFYGGIQQESHCTTCKSNLIYYDRFDSYFCPKCNRWTESKCDDPHCRYCPNRPEKPLAREEI